MIAPRLKEAIDELERLPAAQQVAIAEIVFDELASERLWDQQFSRSQDALAAMADAALAEHLAGRSQPLEDLLK